MTTKHATTKQATYVYAVMSGDTVANVIVAHDTFARGRHDHVRIDHVHPRPGPGWRRAGSRWVAPAAPAVPHAQMTVSLDALVRTYAPTSRGGRPRPRPRPR